tara:strand:- start:324 stop:641 length:318 start_codon:yes stop_codon:yes gene_type:complete
MNYGSKKPKKSMYSMGGSVKKGMYNMGGSVINTGPSKANGDYNPVAADMQRQGMQMGNAMKDGGLITPPNKGAASLPKKVRNKMGFMNKGGLMCGASNPPSKKRT